MTGSGARERQLLTQLESLGNRLHHVHGLVERMAADNQTGDQFNQPIRRAFAQLKIDFASAGLDSMSQVCAGMDLAARRTGGRVMKIRILREGLASLRAQLDAEQRTVRASVNRQAQDERDEQTEQPG